MKKFLVNLKRRPDRLENFFERCPYPKDDIEVVYGFDGKNPTMENKKERKIFNTKFKGIQPGACGCMISHLRIWKKIIDNGLPMAMIFEDDALFNEDFIYKINGINLDTLDFNILYFGGRFAKNHTMTPQTAFPVTKNVVLHNHRNWNNHLHERTTHGYIITLKFARFLIELFNVTEYPEPVDQFIIHSLKDLNVNIHSTHPLLCYSPIVSDSDIRG